MKINKPRVAIFSDLHLGVHSNSSDWHNYAVEWAHWFQEECKLKNIKDLIFCGDWHHNRSEISVNTLQISADILDRGILMTGGGSMLKGIDQLIRERTNVPVNIAEEPLLSVVKGTGKVLEDVKKYESVLI